jgi:Mrp family chromosome partitioning ATPase
MAQSRWDPVLLVDANLRNPMLSARLGALQSPGLADLLRGQAGLDAVIQEIVPDSLFFIAAGIVRQDQPSLLATAMCREVFRAFGVHFGTVIVDSAPVGEFVDGILVAAQAHYVTLVLEKARHRRSELREIGRKLSSVGSGRLGVCLSERNERSRAV